MSEKSVSIKPRNHTRIATIAGGCFWCLEAAFKELRGVGRVVSGYTGGAMPNPTYERVCSGKTGHAEAVQITFNPKVISYRDLLDVFLSIHDPTTLNQQGADIGTQYRSAIFYHSDEQKAVAEQAIQEIENKKIWGSPIVTEIVPFEKFYAAEDYHQDYYRHNSAQPYCRVVINHKLAKFRSHYHNKLKGNS
jgi:peptide-methionine (S)-S-oxide reductase